jgi:hypothetical protein
MFRKIASRQIKANASTEILCNIYRTILILMVFTIYFLSATNISNAVECISPKYWKSRPENQNTIFLYKDITIGAYVARINRIFRLGPAKAHSPRGKYLHTFLYDVVITDVIRGEMESNTHTFLLIGTLSDEGDTHFVIEERYASDSKGAKPHYLAFTISKEIINLNNNNNNKVILGQDIILDNKLRAAIKRYTNSFFFVGDCSNWPVDDIYNGSEYDIINYMNKYLSSKKNPIKDRDFLTLMSMGRLEKNDGRNHCDWREQ